MVMSAHVGAFNTGTGIATTTVAVTGVGFTPKALIFWWSGITGTIDAFSGGHIQRGMGVATSPTSRWAVGTQSEEAQAASDVDRIQRSDACIATASIAGVLEALMDLQSMDADGFTMIVDDAFPASLRIHYLALGGADLTNAATGMLTEPGAIGTQDISGVGFQPDFVLFGSIGLNADPPSVTSTSQMMIGAAVSASEQAVLANSALQAAATMATVAYCVTGECIAFAQFTTVSGRAEFDSFLADGFRLDWVERSSDRRVFYLVLKGGSYQMGDFLTSVTPAATIAETGFGFAPKGAMLLSHGRAANTIDLENDSDQWNVGAFTSTTNRGAQGVLDEDAVADSDLERYVEHDAALAQITITPAVVGLVDVQSIDADGFTLVMDSAADPAAFVWYISFGDTPVPAAPSNLVATAISTTQIDLAWDDNSADETSFRVERSPDGVGSWASVGTPAANAETFSNTGLTCGTQYFYRVFAVNSGGDSTASNTDDATTTACPSTVTVSGTTVTITTSGTVTITGPGGVVYAGGSAQITPPSGAYTWTDDLGGSGSFSISGSAGNRMGGSGAIRKPPRNVTR